MKELHVIACRDCPACLFACLPMPWCCDCTLLTALFSIIATQRVFHLLFCLLGRRLSALISHVSFSLSLSLPSHFLAELPPPQSLSSDVLLTLVLCLSCTAYLLLNPLSSNSPQSELAIHPRWSSYPSSLVSRSRSCIAMAPLSKSTTMTRLSRVSQRSPSTSRLCLALSLASVGKSASPGRRTPFCSTSRSTRGGPAETTAQNPSTTG